jgi:hypothetical protein
MAPNASAAWPNNSSTVQVWVFDIEKDPTESVNLASTQPAILARLIAAFEAYQRGAHDSVLIVGVADPACDPALRIDKAWGPFTPPCPWV